MIIKEEFKKIRKLKKIIMREFVKYIITIMDFSDKYEAENEAEVFADIIINKAIRQNVLMKE